MNFKPINMEAEVEDAEEVARADNTDTDGRSRDPVARTLHALPRASRRGRGRASRRGRGRASRRGRGRASRRGRSRGQR